MLPRCGGLAGSETEAARTDEGLFAARAFDAPGHLGRARKMVDQRRMGDGGFGGVEGGFFNNGRVKGAPARIFAVRNQPIARPQDTAMGFANRENRGGRIVKPSHHPPLYTGVRRNSFVM